MSIPAQAFIPSSHLKSLLYTLKTNEYTVPLGCDYIQNFISQYVSQAANKLLSFTLKKVCS
jgi:hypothetical protein